MSQSLISRSPDLKRLRDEGYYVQIKGSFLIMREVPYVDEQRQVRKGSLISSLALSGDITVQPDTHTVYFDGNYPCGPDGTPIDQIKNESKDLDLGNGVFAKHRFSSKPKEGVYTDYYEKMTTYANILSGPATTLKPNVTARIFREPDDEENSVFKYTETASGRMGIDRITKRLAEEKVAIVGLGGTGSYVLDLVAKTPVKEIRLFDGDQFFQHNAFRFPGAPSIEELRDAPMKVDYLKNIYSRMRRKIIAHTVFIDANNIGLLDGVTFAFICIDRNEAKRLIVEKLEAHNVPFVDVGMGINLGADSLSGILRVTTSTPAKRDHIQKYIPFSGNKEDDIYQSNIQVADLNALNAAMAVIKWKKIRGFYYDYKGEHHSTYTINGNMLLNDER